MDINAIKKTDDAVSAIKTGQWIGEIPQFGDVRLKVRGMTSELFTQTYSRLSRRVPAADRDRDGSLLPNVASNILGQALHSTILLDWENITDDGNSVEFDKALALRWLTELAYRQFADAVVYAAKVVDNGKVATQKALEKNSRKPSGGKSNAATETKS